MTFLEMGERATGTAPEPARKEDFSSGLLWIGPETAGLRRGSGDLAAHVLLKRSPADLSPAVGSACDDLRGDRLLVCKALLPSLDALRGSSFVLPDAPSLRFEFMAGDQAVAASEFHLWYETPPDARQTVCFFHRADWKPGSGGTPKEIRLIERG